MAGPKRGERFRQHEAAPGAVIHTEDLTKIYPGADFAAVDG